MTPVSPSLRPSAVRRMKSAGWYCSGGSMSSQNMRTSVVPQSTWFSGSKEAFCSLRWCFAATSEIAWFSVFDMTACASK